MSDPNFGFPIPTTSNINWNGPAPVRHFVYMFRQASDERIEKKNLPRNSLVLFKVEQSENPPKMLTDVDEVGNYVSKIVLSTETYPWKPASSLDIDAYNQCWIVIELERTINWHFGTTYPAILTALAEEPFVYGDESKHGFNADLRYVFDDGSIQVDPSDGPEGSMCRFVFFRVICRRPRTATKMNFVVELYTVVEGGRAGQGIPIIIDPDVPDDGHDGFPSPPFVSPKSS